MFPTRSSMLDKYDMLLRGDIIPLFMVSYFRPNDFRRCLESILASSAAFHLHIADNSHGGLEDEFRRIDDRRVTIHRNVRNLGKGAAFMRCFNATKKSYDSEWLVSIDADILVQPEWLERLQVAAARVAREMPVAAIAPLILRNAADTPSRQLNAGLVMHRTSKTTAELRPRIFYNRHTAGPLLLINKAFFEQSGGYPTTQLYGNEDGALCAAAAKARMFVGFTTDVQVTHLNADSTPGYVKWKHAHVRGLVTEKGHWD